MAQGPPTDYRSALPHTGAEMHPEGILDHVSEIGEQARNLAGEVAEAARERPYTTIAIVAGLAFAIGAVWKLKQQQPPQSRLDALRARLPEVPNLEGLLPRRWR